VRGAPAGVCAQRHINAGRGDAVRYNLGMTMDEFLSQFGELLEMPAGSLGAQDKLADLEGWNSMAMVGFIAFADEHFGKTLSPRQFANCSTVSDLAGLVGLGA
jgi:acyl carrier protein